MSTWDWEKGQAMYYLASFQLSLAVFMFVASTMGLLSWATIRQLFYDATGSAWLGYTFSSAFVMWAYFMWRWEDKKHVRP